MKNLKLQARLILLLSCMVFRSGVAADSVSKLPLDISQEIKKSECKTEADARTAFSEGCVGETCIVYFGKTGYVSAEKWCGCIEKKFNIENYIAKKCAPPGKNIIKQFWVNETIKKECGTPINPQDDFTPNADFISLKEAKDLFNSQKAIFIDLREADEIRNGKIPGAIVLSYSMMKENKAEWERIVSDLSKEKTLVLYCQTGSRAKIIMGVLREKGFNALNMGGIESWKTANLPFEKK